MKEEIKFPKRGLRKATAVLVYAIGLPVAVAFAVTAWSANALLRLTENMDKVINRLNKTEDERDNI